MLRCIRPVRVLWDFKFFSRFVLGAIWRSRFRWCHPVILWKSPDPIVLYPSCHSSRWTSWSCCACAPLSANVTGPTPWELLRKLWARWSTGHITPLVMWILSISWFHVMMTIPAWRFTPKTPILRTMATTTLLPRQRTSIATKPAAANGYVLSRVQCMCGSSVTTCFDLATSTITLSSPAMVVLQQPRPPQPRRPPPQAQLKGTPWHMHRPHRPQPRKPTGVRTVMLILANAGVAARPCPVKNQSVQQVRPLCKQGVVAASKFTTTWCRVATQNQAIVQPGLSPTLLRRQQFQLFSWSCLLCACCDALEIDICRFLCDFCNCKYLLCLLCTVSYCTEQSQCTLRAWVWLEEFQLSTRSPLKCLLHFDMFLLSLFPTWVRLQCLAFLPAPLPGCSHETPLDVQSS